MRQTITILQYDDVFFLVENSIVSEQEMIDYAHRKIVTTIRHFWLAYSWTPIVAWKFDKMAEKSDTLNP